MLANFWSQFKGLMPSDSLTLATVTAHNADGTSSVTTAEGGEMRVVGQLAQSIPYNVFILRRRIDRAAPSMPQLVLDV